MTFPAPSRAMTAPERQLIVVAVALALWSIAPLPQLWALILAYTLAVLGLSATGALERLAGWSLGARIVLATLLAAPGIANAVRLRGDFVQAEALGGAWPVLVERMGLERTPAIAPPLLSTDRAQRYFVHAPGSSRVRVRFGEGTRELAGELLGHGLFRVDYEPGRDGRPQGGDGVFVATIEADRGRARRQMLAVTPLPHPRWLRVSPRATRAVALSRETDEVVLVSTRGLERRIIVGDEPVACAFVGEQRLVVAHAAGERLSVVDLGSFAVLQGPRVGPAARELAASPDGTSLALVRGGARPALVVLAADGLLPLAEVALPAVPDWVAFGRDARTLVVATRADASLHRFTLDAGGLAPAGVLRLGRAAVTLSRSRSGDSLFVTTTDYRPAGGAHLGNHFVQDQILTVSSHDLAVVDVWRTARRTPRQSKPGDVDRGLSALGVHERRSGGLVVAFAGSEELALLPEQGPERVLADLGASGLYAPHDVAELSDGTLVVSSPSAGALGLLARGRSEVRLLRLAPDDAYLEAHDPAALARRFGERGFYEGTRSGIACQSCHMHGDSDLSAHNLGDRRPLPTLGVAGLLGTPPFLRDGSYARLSELDHVARTLYRGYLRRAPGRAHTLGAFLAALPRPRASADAGDAAAQRRGLDAFVRAQCPRCHAFPAFTHLGQHRLSALFPELVGARSGDESLDTPSLLSVGASPPYLSDGRAPTLEAVLTEHNPSGLHGDSARLSPAERRDLVAFLEAL